MLYKIFMHLYQPFSHFRALFLDFHACITFHA
jgi:hypothetical protein